MNARVIRERFPPAPEIESLNLLASSEEIRGQLSRAASRFGRIVSIMALPEQDGFLVCFEKTADALAASRQWRCFLFGFTTVVVPVIPHASISSAAAA